MFANAFYSAGLRFLDVSNPFQIRQIGWYRPEGSSAFAPYWHKGLLYLADTYRGVDILRFNGGPASRARPGPPPIARTARRLRMDPELGYLCPIA